MNDQRLAGSAGDFEIAAGAAVTGRGIAIVTLFVCLDNPVSANARDGRINAQGEGPAIERAGGCGRIVRQTQYPLAIGGLVAEPGKSRNRIGWSERTEERSDSRANGRGSSVAKRRGEEVRAGWSVGNEDSLRPERRRHENIEVRSRGVRDVNGRNDFAYDACLRDVDGADGPRVIIGNGDGRRIGDDDGHFATTAGNIELTSARATVAARRVAVVALFEAAEQSIAANWGTGAWSTRTGKTRFDDAGRIAAVVGRGIAVVTCFGAIDDAITTGNASARGA